MPRPRRDSIMVAGGDGAPSKDDDDDELAVLQNTLFGSATALPSQSARKHKHAANKPLFRIDVKGAPQAAWVDEDDANVKVNLARTDRLRKLRKVDGDEVVSGADYAERLKAQFERMNGEQTWAVAEPSRDDDAQDDVDVLLARSAPPVASTTSHSADGRLAVARVKDANRHAPCKAVVQAVDWHASGQLLLTASMDKSLHLFRIDGEDNAKVQTVFFQTLPIISAGFAANNDIVLTGRRPYYYSFNADTGHVERFPGILGRKDKSLETMVVSPRGDLAAFGLNDGIVSFVSLATKREVFACRIDKSVRALAFCNGGDALLASGDDGDVYKFDVRMASRRPLWRRADVGSLGTRSLAAGPAHYAVGSTSGVVNVYDDATGNTAATYMNLTTAVDCLDFSADGRLLAMASARNKDALKLARAPHGRVVSNWPTQRTPLSYVSVAKFSPNAGYLAVGNDKGRVLLYRLLDTERA